ncbi:helix-turn-helix domain-containing protein [Streptomyces lydicus]|uniref:helix-turn-helix domain-containing protein n=1 Tax=Streptomyces lydicus TaxID=47763 RepID=UPI0037BC3FB5
MKFQPNDLKPDRSARDFFGAEIRRYREKAGMSLLQLAEILNYSKSFVARIETAEQLPYDDVPAKLDAHFGTDGHFGRLYALARNERVPGKYRRMMELEDQATRIEEYTSGAVPGLLQTPELAECWLRCGHPHAPDEEIESLVQARMDRQARLSAPKPPHCWFIVDEAVLRRPVGSHQVMARQMKSLIERGRAPHITLQVLPFAAGEHPQVLGGSLALYTVPNQPLVAYEEGSRSGSIMEDQATVAEYQESYDLLRAMALSPRDSEAMIRAAMEDWQPCGPHRT